MSNKKYCEMDTIERTVERLNDEGISGITCYTLRQWVRSGAIPTVRAGNKYLLFYPNVRQFLCGEVSING